ncbi:YheT family hydrolase [Leptospira ilyithenensis]|uniref:Alpha/beta fold hydrolase n=1 Tax=Leptospira ilyithenensis TaxID=2484901 RepID=A0A4V3JXB2_9LEPT|nr:alpha/beta fold hydrolase [Leptospira ilyithenensis]TGN13712.1 alpha/beta fold hydrolase [Leptospira ilyithenensis]
MSSFKPLPFFSGPMIQSLFASWKSKQDKSYPFLKKSRWHLIKTDGNVSLLAALNEVEEAKGTLILLHGWEGSIHSSYIVRTANHFLQKGFSIFRLNLRDHGETHHLNEGIFNGSLFEETYEAVRILSLKTDKTKPVYLIGFSLGGNFVLRILHRHSLEKKSNQIQNLKYSFSISPALDPYEATLKMDEHPILKKYFLKAWSRSLKKKAALFPFLYEFGNISRHKSVMDLTEKLISDYSEFADVLEYFSTYTLKPDFFSKIKTPVTVLTSADDPVIPVSHFYTIPRNPYLEVVVESKGGHCGFIEDGNRNAYYWKIMERKMN